MTYLYNPWTLCLPILNTIQENIFFTLLLQTKCWPVAVSVLKCYNWRSIQRGANQLPVTSHTHTDCGDKCALHTGLMACSPGVHDVAIQNYTKFDESYTKLSNMNDPKMVKTQPSRTGSAPNIYHFRSQTEEVSAINFQKIHKLVLGMSCLQKLNTHRHTNRPST